MTFFWLACAGLMLLALGLLLPSLLRRRLMAGDASPQSARRSNLTILGEQLQQLDADLGAGRISAEQHRLSRGEIERRVLDEENVDEAPPTRRPARLTALAMALAVPLFASGAYALFGNLAALDPKASHARAEPSGDITLAQVEDMVDKLAKRLEGQTAPQAGDAEAWTMLARSYTALQRLDESSRAYIRAIALAPMDAQLLADHADVLGALQGQKLAGEPMKLVEQALKLDPRNPKALALAGGGAYERDDFAGAIRYWTEARQNVPADSEFARGLDSSIVEARAAVAQRSGAAASGPAPAAAPVQLAGAQITGRVSLAPALAARAAPGDTVFIFARAAEGPRVPLAVLKRTVAELPISFTLDDSMAMSPQMKLSNFPLVVVGARVSKSGNATPQPGDLQGQAAPSKLGSQGIELVIDSVQP